MYRNPGIDCGRLCYIIRRINRRRTLDLKMGLLCSHRTMRTRVSVAHKIKKSELLKSEIIYETMGMVIDLKQKI